MKALPADLDEAKDFFCPKSVQQLTFQSVKSKMSIVIPEATQFQHIIRLLNTNIDGKRKIMYAMTDIKGVGRRFSNIVLKKADVDITKR